MCHDIADVLFFFFLMIRRPPRSTLDRSSAASDVYKRQVMYCPEVKIIHHESKTTGRFDNVIANSKLLNYKWNGKINSDDLKKEFMPKVSIVIPVHNQLDYTKKCLDSIRKYTNIPYEIIIVNDASTDQTNDYLKTQKDIIIKNNEYKKGYPASCNFGIRLSLIHI